MHRERRNEQNRKYRHKKGAPYLKNYELVKKYGITLDDYNLILEQQGNSCKICKSKECGGRGWHLNHNHTTGKIRSILCQRCNLMIGHARDDISVLEAAILYLKDHEGE